MGQVNISFQNPPHPTHTHTQAPELRVWCLHLATCPPASHGQSKCKQKNPFKYLLLCLILGKLSCDILGKYHPRILLRRFQPQPYSCSTYFAQSGVEQPSAVILINYASLVLELITVCNISLPAVTCTNTIHGSHVMKKSNCCVRYHSATKQMLLLYCSILL